MKQNLQARKLGLIVLSTNNWNVLKKNTQPVAQAIEAATPGSFQVVTITA